MFSPHLTLLVGHNLIGHTLVWSLHLACEILAVHNTQGGTDARFALSSKANNSSSCCQVVLQDCVYKALVFKYTVLTKYLGKTLNIFTI